MTRAHHRWSTSEKELVAERWSSGASDQEIAAELGVTVHGVLKQRHLIGCVTYRRQPWTEKDDKELLSLVSEGMTSNEIAKRMSDGRRASCVRARLCSLRARVKTDGDALVLVGCAKIQGQRGPAESLYKSRVFKAALRYARAISDDDRIRVLSGAHGLVCLDQILDPYDDRPSGARARRRWAVLVGNAINELEPCRVVALAGRSYIAPWRALVRADVDEPLAGLASGPRYARLLEMIERAT